MGRPKLMQQGDGKKRKRQKKDKDAPKRPCTAFFFFVKHLRNMGEDKDMKVSEFTKMCGVRWRGFGDKSQEKMKFEELASKDRQRYDMEKANYIGTSMRVKDPNKPKRPQTAFLLFIASVRPKLKAQGVDHKGVLVKAGEMWRMMTDEEKSPFQFEADKLKKKHEEEMKAYLERPRPVVQQQQQQQHHVMPTGMMQPSMSMPMPMPLNMHVNSGRDESDDMSDDDDDMEDDESDLDSDDE